MPAAIGTTHELAATVETWVLQAVAASRCLARLYRALGDGRQAASAILAGQSATERMERMGLQARLATLNLPFSSTRLDETQVEEAAWQCLVSAQAGLCAYLALLDWMGQPAAGLQGQRTATHKALRRSLASYRIAFPEEMATRGIAQAFEEAAQTGTAAFRKEVEHLPEQERADALDEVRRRILQSLSALAANG